MPLPLSSGIYWASFVTFLALRRESLVRFLEDNDAKLSFDKRYVDLFFNELSFAFRTTGIQATRSPFHEVVSDKALIDIVLKLHSHCDSDLDVWAAITSGCFRTDDISDKDCKGAVAGWWLRTPEKPTFDSVVADWESVMRDAAANTVPRPGMHTAAETLELLREVVQTIQADVNKTLEMANDVKDTLMAVADHSETWGKVTGYI